MPTEIAQWFADVHHARPDVGRPAVDYCRAKTTLIGQQVNYYGANSNTSLTAKMLEFGRKHEVVCDVATQKVWSATYTAINLCETDAKTRETNRADLSRHKVAAGQTVSFIDSDTKRSSFSTIRRSSLRATGRSGRRHTATCTERWTATHHRSNSALTGPLDAYD